MFIGIGLAGKVLLVSEDARSLIVNFNYLKQIYADILNNFM